MTVLGKNLTEVEAVEILQGAAALLVVTLVFVVVVIPMMILHARPWPRKLD